MHAMVPCGVCRTDLHVVDGELPDGILPIIPGHEIVGRVDSMGAAVKNLQLGERVGIPWLGYTDGSCPYCLMQREEALDDLRAGRFEGAPVLTLRLALLESRRCPLPWLHAAV
jgi:D-arabinose 1-dehydrogenase-like Zn-dependent alcohol dehydrogenase